MSSFFTWTSAADAARRCKCAIGYAATAWRADIRGVAAVEFACIVPLILIMFIGTIEVSRAVSMNRRFAQVTSMVADLVAREETMTSADVVAIYAIADVVMSPFDADSLKISIIPVKVHPSPAKLSIRRVYAATTNRPSLNGGRVPAQCADYPLPDGLASSGSSVIVVEAEYTYVPLFASYLLSATTWTDKAYSYPRNSCVDFDKNNCVANGCFS